MHNENKKYSIMVKEWDNMTVEEIQPRINEIRITNLSGNQTEVSSCDICNCTHSDSVTDENKSNGIRAKII